MRAQTTIDFFVRNLLAHHFRLVPQLEQNLQSGLSLLPHSKQNLNVACDVSDAPSLSCFVALSKRLPIRRLYGANGVNPIITSAISGDFFASPLATAVTLGSFKTLAADTTGILPTLLSTVFPRFLIAPDNLSELYGIFVSKLE